MEDLLKKAKNQDSFAKEEIIKMYYPLIIKEAKGIYLKNKSFDDLIQIGIVNLLNAINKFDLSKKASSFPSYALWAIKNGFRYICRREIKYNDEFSLNKTTDDGYELGESILDAGTNPEEDVINDILYERLYLALDYLDPEERELIEFLYISNKKPNLSKYSILKDKDYYYCSCLKKRALHKLKSITLNVY
ncbi:sigma-70 family RNA polymerase sigma factor [Clostridium sp. MB05]|uniref:sigma-70 family RNA polymerase sigma factor n=1 Tax=Clostridium sp. MB05 TaxID=3376682 RepID=UPI0039829153